MSAPADVGRGGSAPNLPVHESTPADTRVQVSTGTLPDFATVRDLLAAAHRTYRGRHRRSRGRLHPGAGAGLPGAVRHRGRRGAAVASRGSATARTPFTIQSVAKPFVFALVCEALGHREVRERLGVNGTGLPFNSVMAVELATDGLTNPMVNSGAIATTSLAPGRPADAKWALPARRGCRGSPGATWSSTRRCYASERATNGRNEAIAHLLESTAGIYFDPDEATDVYTRQCSLLVTAEDLARDGRHARRRRRQPGHAASAWSARTPAGASWP